MLYLFTDFGWKGPYVGQMKTKVIEYAHKCQVIDLMHDVPCFNVKSGAYLLAAVSTHLPADCVVISVVDPTVGSKRRGLVLRADYRWFVGPDNGLFDIVAQQAHSCHWYEIKLSNKGVSASFHGRDIFAPVASRLLMEDARDDFLSPIAMPKRLFEKADLDEIIYIDQFGGLMTGLRAKTLGESAISIGNQKLTHANTFSEVSEGEAFYYENSQGLIEISVNCGNASERFSAKIGDSISIVNR